MHEMIKKIKLWCEQNKFRETSPDYENEEKIINYYFIYNEGKTETIDIFFGRNDKPLKILYNLYFRIDTQSDMVTFELTNLSEDAYDNMYGDSMKFSHCDYIMGDSFYLKDIEENISSLRNRLTILGVDLTPFPVLQSEL